MGLNSWVKFKWAYLKGEWRNVSEEGVRGCIYVNPILNSQIPQTGCIYWPAEQL